ncbi:MAG: DMT family transporter [Rhodospirillaceae bacterium]|jgi:drug/metabolite transporter (DMT)-like permease|nr:DMT family transporter [Rhodospirillaceae bacterium]
MLGGMFLFSAVDALAKFLTETLHPLQIVWSRQLGLLIGILLILAFRGGIILQTRHLGLQVARGAAAAGSATLFVIAVSYVPLADAITVTFVAPFLVTLLGALVLRESVGVRRWSAVALGFIGVLIVTRPGMGVVHPAVFLVLLAAFLFAIRQIISRAVARTDRIVTTVAYTALVGSAILTVPLPLVWRSLTSDLELYLLIGMAGLAAIAEILVIKALDVADAVVVAPVHYSILIWATFYGFMIFGQLPDFWTWIGASVIIVTGIYTLHRDWRSGTNRTQT